MKFRVKMGFPQSAMLVSLCIFVLSVSMSFLLSNYVIEKTYESTGVLIIYSDRENDDNRALRDAKTYRTIATGTQMMNEIISQLNLQYRVKDLRNKIIVSYEDDTDLIYIKSEDGDPETAFNITRFVMDRLQGRVQELFGDSYLKVVEEPYIPFEPSRPNVVLNMMIAGIFAMLLSALVIVWDLKRR